MISTAPAALLALVGLAREALPEGVQVEDGPPVTNIEDDAVWIGYTGESGIPALSANQVAGEVALPGQIETYDVSSLITISRGADRVAEPRERCFELFGLLLSGLTADKTLGGVVKLAVVTSWEFTQPQTQTGPQARLLFTVQIKAFI